MSYEDASACLGGAAIAGTVFFIVGMTMVAWPAPELHSVGRLFLEFAVASGIIFALIAPRFNRLALHRERAAEAGTRAVTAALRLPSPGDTAQTSFPVEGE